MNVGSLIQVGKKTQDIELNFFESAIFLIGLSITVGIMLFILSVVFVIIAVMC